MKSNPRLPSDLRFDSRLLQLDPRDNVLTVIEALRANDHVWIDGEWIRITQPIPTGCKLAASDLQVGATVLKYGVTIGTTVCPLRKGDVVQNNSLRTDLASPSTYMQEPAGIYLVGHNPGV